MSLLIFTPSHLINKMFLLKWSNRDNTVQVLELKKKSLFSLILILLLLFQNHLSRSKELVNRGAVVWKSRGEKKLDYYLKLIDFSLLQNVKRSKLKHHLVALNCVLLKVAPNFPQFKTIIILLCIYIYAYVFRKEKKHIFNLYAGVGSWGKL